MKASEPDWRKDAPQRARAAGASARNRGRLPVEELDKLWREYQETPAEEIRNLLVEHYLPVVKYTAARIYGLLPNSVDQNDLMSAGVFGLMEAIDHFDLERGVKFETYCTCRVRGAILDELRSQDWLPRVARQRAQKLEAAYRDLRSQLGREPHDEELADAFGVPVKELNKIIMEANTASMMSLDRDRSPSGNYDGEEFSELNLLADGRVADPAERLQRHDVISIVSKGLSEQERLILVLYYFERLTMKEIGCVMGVTESRISQIHGRVLLRLRSLLRRRQGELMA